MLHSKRMILTVLSGLLAMPAFSVHGAGIIAKDIDYGGYKGYIARPDDGKAHPALILIHEWWGLNDNIKANARKFAEKGYVALSVDLYGGEVAKTRTKARELATAVRKNRAGAIANLKQAVSWLKGNAGFADSARLASVGWCFGGGWSYQMARNALGVKASVIYYGFFNPADDLSKMRATILGHFGEKDRAIKVDNVREFQVKLKTISGDHAVYIYPNAGHAFANEGGKNYDAKAANTAWSRTLAFLGKTLK